MAAKKIIVANWKLNPDSPKKAVALAKAIEKGIGRVQNIETVIAPPFPFLEDVGKVLRRSRLGAQDVFWEKSGAYTGEVSTPELESLDVRYVIVGHSERRKLLAENDEIVARKVKAAAASGLIPIICVGEPFEIRRTGTSSAERFVEQQLRRDLQTAAIVSKNIIIAYEPIWAIGSGMPDTAKGAAHMARWIKSVVRSVAGREPAVLYGGSVTGRNSGQFFAEPAIDGALVGGASLKAAEFAKIVKSAV